MSVTKESDQVLAIGLLGIMSRHLDFPVPLVEQGHGHGRGCLGGFEGRSDSLGGIGSSLDAGDIGVGKHFKHWRLKDTYKRIGPLS
jgi:hypothetical protein